MRSKVIRLALLSSTLFSAKGFSIEEGYWTLLADFIYMQRYDSQNQVLAFDSSRCVDVCPQGVSLKVNDMVSAFGFEPGLQTMLSYVQNEHSSYDLGFVYIWDWNSTKTRESTKSSLAFPFDSPSFARVFYQFSDLEAYYRSQFYTAELNYDRVFSDSRNSLLVLSGIGGLRFASLGEKFTLNVSGNNGQGSYEIKTNNDLIGVQLGFGFRINASKGFHWDLDGKAGVGLNRIEAESFLSDKTRSVQLRNFSKQDWQTNIFAEASAGLGCQPIPALDIHAGYEMLYFCGLALAPDQIDRSSRRTGLKVRDNGYIIAHGFYGGMTFRF